MFVLTTGAGPAWGSEEKGVKAKPSPAVLPIRYVIPPVKYRSQKEKGDSQWCVVYSTWMLLSRYGIEEKPEVIAEAFGMSHRSQAYFSWKSFFSRKGSVESLLNEKHLTTRKKVFVQLRESHVDWLKESIRQGNPALLLYGRLKGHAILAVGYDEKYIFINDPSGAFFYTAQKALKRNIYPRTFCRVERSSLYQGAGVKWGDFLEFIKRRNLWGLMISAHKKRD